MFLSQLPYVPLGHFAWCGVLPEFSGRHRRRHLARRPEQGGTRPLCDRLDEERDWAKVLSPASNNVLPSPASCSPTAGGIPRRVHLRTRRRVGVRALPDAAQRTARTASWLASAIATPSSSTTSKQLRIAWQRPMATQPDRQGARRRSSCLLPRALRRCVFTVACAPAAAWCSGETPEE